MNSAVLAVLFAGLLLVSVLVAVAVGAIFGHGLAGMAAAATVSGVMMGLGGMALAYAELEERVREVTEW